MAIFSVGQSIIAGADFPMALMLLQFVSFLILTAVVYLQHRHTGSFEMALLSHTIPVVSERLTFPLRSEIVASRALIRCSGTWGSSGICTNRQGSRVCRWVDKDNPIALWHLGFLSHLDEPVLGIVPDFQQRCQHIPKINLSNVRQDVRATHPHLVRHQTKGQVSLAPPPSPILPSHGPPCRCRLARANPRGSDVVCLKESPNYSTESDVIRSRSGLARQDPPRDTARLRVHPDRLV